MVENYSDCWTCCTFQETPKRIAAAAPAAVELQKPDFCCRTSTTPRIEKTFSRPLAVLLRVQKRRLQEVPKRFFQLLHINNMSSLTFYSPGLDVRPVSYFFKYGALQPSIVKFIHKTGWVSQRKDRFFNCPVILFHGDISPQEKELTKGVDHVLERILRRLAGSF